MRTENKRDHFERYAVITIMTSIVLFVGCIGFNSICIRMDNYDNYKSTEQKRMEAMEQSIIEYKRNHVTTISKVPFVPPKGFTSSYTLIP